MLKAVVWAHNAAGWIFCQRPQAASFLAARSAAAQEPWDELVHARGRPQIDEPGQDVDEICLRIDSGQLAVPTRSTMWVSSSILDAAIIKDLVSLMARRNPEPRTTLHVAAAGCPGHWLPPAADPCHCATNVCGVVGRFMIPKIKREPLGRPTRWGSLSSEWKI